MILHGIYEEGGKGEKGKKTVFRNPEKLKREREKENTA
jgi:hypothetical protein